MDKKFRLIYIIGTGRSGSTLIDVILGNSQKIKSTGELYNVLGALQKNKKCSCSKEANDCTFWSEVNKLTGNLFQNSEAEEIKKTQHRIERSITAPLNILRNKIKPTGEFRLYKRFLHGFYTIIFNISDKLIFVDSSKNPFRGYVLLNIFKENIYFIHLIRDGRGTMWSWMKTGKIPPFDISIMKKKNGKKVKKPYYWWTPWIYALSWMIYNLISSFVIWRAGPKQSIRIQYEDFLRNPFVHINRISELINEDLSDLVDRFERKESFITDHLLTGNRLRMQKQIFVRLPDEKWKTNLIDEHKKIFWLVAGWLARIYGYRFDD